MQHPARNGAFPHLDAVGPRAISHPRNGPVLDTVATLARRREPLKLGTVSAAIVRAEGGDGYRPYHVFLSPSDGAGRRRPRAHKRITGPSGGVSDPAESTTRIEVPTRTVPGDGPKAQSLARRQVDHYVIDHVYARAIKTGRSESPRAALFSLRHRTRAPRRAANAPALHGESG